MRLLAVLSALVSFTLPLRGQAINLAARCGGGEPYCARYDRDVLTVPVVAPPAVNVVTIDPNFQSRFVRVTDETTSVFMGSQFFADPLSTSSSAEQVQFNSNTTRFYVEDFRRGVVLPFSVNQATLQTARISIPGNFLDTEGATWSYTNPDYTYAWARTGGNFSLYRYNFADNSATQIVNFQTACGFSTSSGQPDDPSVNKTDTRFLMGMGPGSDNWNVVGVYDTTLGCRFYHTDTKAIGGQYGPVGNATTSSTCNMHNSRLSKDGKYAIITCTGGVPLLIWEVDTLNVQSSSSNVSGHRADGYAHNVNSPNNVDYLGDVIRRDLGSFSDSSNVKLVFPQFATTTLLGDMHWSWNDVTGSNDNEPVCSAAWRDAAPWTTIYHAGDMEVICVRTNGLVSTVWRFMHHHAGAGFNSTSSIHNFTATPRGTLSQNGRLMTLTSTWDWKEGCSRDPGENAQFIANHLYSLNDILCDSNAAIEKATTGGTSAGSEPTWCTTDTCTTVSGTATFTRQSGIGTTQNVGTSRTDVYLVRLE